MTHQRDMLAGMTDYTGVSLKDIVSDFQDWLSNTEETIENLRSYLLKIEDNRSLIENPKAVSSFLSHFINLFGRYKADLQTLVNELPVGVVEAHIEIVRQLHKSAMLEDDYTIRFKNDWVYKALPHEEMRLLLDDIYGDTRDMIVDYCDLSNVITRLKTFLRSATSKDEVLNNIELKPNFFGIGINLNRILAKIRKRWKMRK